MSVVLRDWNKIVVIIFCILLNMSKAFERCSVLTAQNDIVCDCSAGGFSIVPDECPRNTTYFILDFNNFTVLTPYSFNKTPEVRIISLRFCNISKLENYTFHGLYDLENLTLSSNKIREIPIGIFNTTKKLQHLDLDNNEITRFPDDQISILTKLHFLAVGGFFTRERLGDGLKQLKQLEIFWLSAKIIEVYKDTFANLEQLPIKRFVLRGQFSILHKDALKYLNSVTDITVSGYFIQLSEVMEAFHTFKDRYFDSVDLSYNFKIGPTFLLNNSLSTLGNICIKKLSLRDNFIVSIDGRFIETVNPKYRQCIEEIDLSQNDIMYNYNYGWVLKLQLFPNLRRLDFSMQGSCIRSQHLINKFKNDVDRIIMYVPRNLTFANVSNIPFAGSMLDVEIGNSVLLETLDMSSLKLDDCNGRLSGLSYLKVLNFSNIHCSSLNPHIFENLTGLRTLIMVNSMLSVGLEQDLNGIFLRGMSELENIDISNNGLSRLHRNLFKWSLKSLKYISLQGNRLTDIPTAISGATNLQHLDMRGNNIWYLKKDTMKFIDKIEQGSNLTILLFGNPLLCNCESIIFIQWMMTTNTQFDNNLRNFTCVDIDGAVTYTTTIYENIRVMQIKCISKYWLILCVICFLFFVLVVISCSCIYRYRITLHYTYLVVKKLITQQRLHMEDKSKYIYDAFVTYNERNYNWVCGPLLQYLEEEKKLKLCLHQRDFVPGQDIQENIFSAIRDSRKVIVVLSKKFLSSHWGKFELDMAWMHMYQQERQLLIVIMLEHIPQKDMPEILQRIWEKIVVLEVDNFIVNDRIPNVQHLFWKRLYHSIVM